ncbi:MAG: TRAP transporter small permease [Deltaproteobacteria bacterium]|nr:MAG: TRAP transporter small permease [Deltaproteobacteria bacterium]
MQRTMDYFGHVLEIGLVTIFSILLSLVSYQVFARYIGFIPRFLWTEEVSRACFIWMVMIGASLGVRQQRHFAIDALVEKFGGRSKFILQLFINVAVLCGSISFLWYGWGFLEMGSRRVSLVTGLPMTWAYASFFLSGLFMSLFCLVLIIRQVSDARRKQTRV